MDKKRKFKEFCSMCKFRYGTWTCVHTISKTQKWASLYCDQCKKTSSNRLDVYGIKMEFSLCDTTTFS